jgi:hypothetical protein
MSTVKRHFGRIEPRTHLAVLIDDPDRDVGV